MKERRRRLSRRRRKTRLVTMLLVWGSNYRRVIGSRATSSSIEEVHSIGKHNSTSSRIVDGAVLHNSRTRWVVSAYILGSLGGGIDWSRLRYPVGSPVGL